MAAWTAHLGRQPREQGGLESRQGRPDHDRGGRVGEGDAPALQLGPARAHEQRGYGHHDL